MMKARTSLVLVSGLSLFVIGVNPGHTQIRTLKRTVVSGQETLLTFSAGLNQNCESGNFIEARITVPAKNGTATMRRGKFMSGGPSKRARSVVCAERMRTGYGVYYRSRPGFRGTDQFEYVFHYSGRGGRWPERAIVTVR
jgi:hypothetical protein